MAGHTSWHSAVIWWYIKYYPSLVQPNTAPCGTGILGEQGHLPARPLALCCRSSTRGQSHTTWAYSPCTGIVLSSVSQWPLLPHYQCRQEHHHYTGQIFDEQENKCDDWYLFTVCIYGIILMYFTTRYSNSLSLSFFYKQLLFLRQLLSILLYIRVDWGNIWPANSSRLQAAGYREVLVALPPGAVRLCIRNEPACRTAWCPGRRTPAACWTCR